jgi:adenylate cyclase
MTKYYGLPAIITEDTAERANGIPFLEVDLIKVKGRNQATRIYTMLDMLEIDRARHGQLIAAHTAFLDAYRSGDWQKAQAALDKCLALGFATLKPMYDLFAHRVADLKTQPAIAAHWDGVYTAQEK